MIATDSIDGFWKELFNLLFNNSESDEKMPNFWALFKSANLRKSDIRAALETFQESLHEDTREKLCNKKSAENEIDVSSVPPKEESSRYRIREEVLEKLCDLNLSGNCNASSVLSCLRESSYLDDNFWRLLFTAIRDSQVEEISKERKMRILEGGQTKDMSMEDIERKFISENPDLLSVQKCVPDQMIHEDLIDAQFNTDHVRECLRRSYEKKLASESLVRDNPNRTTEGIKKQAKQEIKDSKEAKLLQKRVAMIAEEKVQKSILSAMKKFNIPVYVFRGVNTYSSIGKFLESFGMKMSTLKAFKAKDSNSKCTLECEHDIATLALLPSGPLASFVQVFHSCPSFI